MSKKVLLSLFGLLVIIIGGVIAWRSVDIKPVTQQGTTYLVSLGDSVAAGDGLPIPKSADAVTSACARSDQAYPSLLAFQLNSKLIQFACSGAKVTTGLLQPQAAFSQTLPPQISAASKYILNNNVVLTIGANDVDWNTLLTSCVRSDCTNADNLADYQARLAQMGANLTSALQQINSYHPHHVIVNTYYSLIRDTDSCFSSYGVTTSKIQYVNAREAELNTVIATAAQTNGLKAVHIDFSNHLLCDKNSWIQTLSNSAPLHPTKDGQLQIASQDLAALK